VAEEEILKDAAFIIRELPTVISRLQTHSKVSGSLIMNLLGQQIGCSLAKRFSSRDVTGTLFEMSKILDNMGLGKIAVFESYAFELQGCIGCEEGSSQGVSLRCQLLTRVFELSLEERLATSCVVRWIERRNRNGFNNCVFRVRVL